MEFIARNEVFLDRIVCKDPASVTEITVPEGFKVLTERVFSRFVNLERVIFPKSLEYLERNCFQNCKNLKDIVMPGILSLDQNEFVDCVSVKTLVVPKTIQRIGSSAFEELKKLKKLVFEGLDNFEYSAFVAFSGVEEEMVVYPEESEKPVIPYTKSMGEYTIDEEKANALRGKPPIVQAREYVLEDIENLRFPPRRSQYHWHIEAFANSFRRVRKFIMEDGLLVGFIINTYDANHNAVPAPILIEQTIPYRFETHTVGGDNNGAGYKGGESFTVQEHVTLLPYGWDTKEEN